VIQLLWSSVLLFLSEALLALAFFVGLLFFLRLGARWIRSVLFRRAYVEYRGFVPSERFLVRWLFWQVVFVAVWSVLFKAVLYTTLRHSFARHLLSTGQSLGIAVPAEVLMMFVVLVGALVWVSRAVSRVSARVASDA
jgi:hypothetical protein